MCVGGVDTVSILPSSCGGRRVLVPSGDIRPSGDADVASSDSVAGVLRVVLRGRREYCFGVVSFSSPLIKGKGNRDKVLCRSGI